MQVSPRSIIKDSIGTARGHFWPHFWKSGVVIQKLQFLKMYEKINKNANCLMSQTCLMRNTWNMKILQRFAKTHWFKLGIGRLCIGPAVITTVITTVITAGESLGSLGHQSLTVIKTRVSCPDSQCSHQWMDMLFRGQRHSCLCWDRHIHRSGGWQG